MTVIARATIIPVIRLATKTVVGAYNLSGFKGFLGNETTYTLPSGKVINIQKWTPDRPNLYSANAPWVMATVIDEPTYKSDSWQGYLEIFRIGDMMDSTQFVAATGLPQRISHTNGTLFDLLSFSSTVDRAPVNNVSPVAAGSTASGGVATCTTGTWVGGTISYTYQWYMETGVASGVFAAATGAGNATASYTVAAGSNGKKIFCRVKATDSSGFTTADSNQRTMTS